MPSFDINVVEVQNQVITVDAACLEDALAEVKRMWKEDEIEFLPYENSNFTVDFIPLED